MKRIITSLLIALLSVPISVFAVGTEQLLYSTNFQDWTAVSASAGTTNVSLSTNYGESFTTSLTNCGVFPADPGKPPTASVGAVKFAKIGEAGLVQATFVTTEFASITKIVLAGYTTGSSRGYSIYTKTSTDLDWVLNSTKIVLQAGEIVTIPINLENVAIKIINNPNTQYFLLSDLAIYGNTTAVVPVFQSSTPASLSVIPTGGTIKLTYSEPITRGIGDITLGGAVISESDITFNGSEVTIAYSGLSTDASYNLVIPAGAFLNGSSVANPAATTLSFTTPDTQAPVCSFQTDGNGVTIPINGTVALLFNEQVKAGAVPATIGSINITPSISPSQNYLVYLNFSGLDYATNYTITIPSGAITDMEGNPAAAKTIAVTTEGDFKGSSLLSVTPNATDFPTTLSGDVTKTITGTDAVTLYNVTFGNVATPQDRGSNGWGFKTDYVLLPKTAIGNVSFKIQCGGGSTPQKFYIQKLGVDGVTWSNIDTIMIGTNDVITFTSAVAQSSDSTTIRLHKDGANFWFYNVSIYDFLDNNAAADDGLDPSIVSSIPANNVIDIATSGTIKITFSESVKSGSANFILNGKTLTPNILGKVVSLPFSNLKYSTLYPLTIEAGAVTDNLGNACAAATINITTKAKPAVTPSLFDFVVAQDGSGNGLTIQSAFDAVPVNNTAVFRIFVKKGTYAEYPTLADGKTNVSLIGQHRDSVIITGNHYSGLVSGITYTTSNCQTLEIFGDNFYCENITVKNTAGRDIGQAVALKVYADKAVFKNVRLLSYQDTHLTSNVASDRQYYLNCDIHGTVDFIFNDGVAYFDNCSLYIEDRATANVVCAPATNSTNPYGFVFSDCTIDGASSQDGVYYLARPWKNAPRAVYLNTKMNILPANDAWTTMSALPALFVEYNSVSRNGSALTFAPRVDFTFTNSSAVVINDSLTTIRPSSIDATQAALYTRDNVLNGSDSWDATTKIGAPAAVENLTYNAADSKLTWTAVDGAACYVIITNGTVVGFSTLPEYATSQPSTTYYVLAASEYGALSESVSVTTGISNSVREKKGFLVATIVTNEISLINPTNFSVVEVISLSGNTMISSQLKGSSIPVNNLQNGCYLVKGTAKNGEVYVDKIIKK
ncbi:MAG: Ig-like domain-containing protein [Paludibacteraceae bacterium]|nr:Ig-like domain-containing protein [Paludibacteraceae bacterium]MBN2786844.1 Ig-like domain-containing protein [Paludibacteraceae bacterium]